MLQPVRSSQRRRRFRPYRMSVKPSEKRVRALSRVRNRVRMPMTAAMRTDIGMDIGMASASQNSHVEGEMVSFSGLSDGKEHVALVLGSSKKAATATATAASAPLVRLHSECLTGDVFASKRCDCGPQLNEAIHRISQEHGYILYLRQEGRGIGLYNKLDAYRLQQDGMDTFAANSKLGFDDDLRDFSVAAEMLKALGVKRIRLLSNNPDKALQLKKHGVHVEEVLPTGVHLCEQNFGYLAAKKRHSRHTLDIPYQRETGTSS